MPARWQVIAALLAVYLIWGSTYLAVRYAVEGIPPFLMTGVRFVIAGGALFLLMRVQGNAAPTWRQWRNAAIVGVMLMGGGMGGVAFAEQWVASGLAAMMVASMPLWAALFAGLFGRWATRGEWLGLIVGFAGVIMLNIEGGLRGNPAAAIALALGAANWALGSILSRRMDLPSGLMASAAEMLTGGAALLVLSVISGEQLTGMPPLGSVLALGYLIVAGSLIAYTTYMWLLANVRPSLATSYAYVNPVVAVLLGLTIGGETIGTLGLLAMPVILAGVAILALARSRQS